jgi:TolB-like protein/DNA-binding SARP family transcriptional activator
MQFALCYKHMSWGQLGMRHAERQDVFQPAHNAAHASLFGSFQLATADGTEILISNRRAKALLAMLCLVRDESIDRDYLSKLLWPGRFEAHAKASLRQCLLELGKLLEPFGSEILQVTRNGVCLNSAAIATDLGELEAALAGGNIVDAASRISAIGITPLVDRMDFGEAFNNWLSNLRSQAEHRLQVAVDGALAASAQRGDMEGHGALAKAWALRNPSAPLKAAVAITATKTRIAILPFQALHAKDAEDYFADGIVDEMITTLGQVPQLLVAGRTSSFHFRNSDLSSPDIAEALRVTHLIEGSVQLQGEKVRIFVRLIDGRDGFEIWGDRYDGSLDDILTLQENVAYAVTAALSGALGLVVQPPAGRSMTSNKFAYDLYLQGRALIARMFGEGILEKAIDFLEQAVALDPKFVGAWVALAEAHQLVAVYTPCLERIAESEKMAVCARRAHGIDPNCAEAYSLLGVHHWTHNDIVGALDLAFKAYRMEPENPAVEMRLGSFLLYCGRTRQAMSYIEAAIDRDPADGRKYALLCMGRLNAGDLAGAIKAGERMVDLGFPSMWLALATAASGENDRAVELYQQTRLLMNKVMFPPAGTTSMSTEAMAAYWLMAAKGVCSGNPQDRDRYCQMLDMHHATLHDSSDPLIVLPAIFMGYADMVFKTVGAAITPANTLCLMSLWSDIDPIRQIWQHPEFIPFAQRIGMAAAWDKYGWPDLLPPPNNL